MHHQTRTIECGDDTERDDASTADGKGHRETGQDAAKEAGKNNDQANFDPVETK